MKKTIIALAAIYMSVVAFTYRVSAQGSNNVIAFTDTKAFARSLQLVAFFDDSSSTATAADLKTINTKAIKDFASKFGTNRNEYWLKASDGFVSNFKTDGFLNRVYYDTKGRWRFTVNTYAENKLPRDIRAIVKSTYYDYKITMVEEVRSADNLVYIIHQEDDKHIMKLRIFQDGEVDIMEELDKG
jgi:hypothetical protein